MTETSPQVAAKVRSRHSKLAWALATFFGTGYLKPGPGTWASAFTVLLWWVSVHTIPHAANWRYTAAVAALATLIGIPASTVVANESGVPDPSYVVLDEVAGQLLALILIPMQWQYVVASLILFRGFDIVKPFPLRWLEKLPAGSGIMLDDVGAGFYAWFVVQAALHLRFLS